MIKIIGLPPAFDLLPMRAVCALDEAENIVLQSEKQPCAAELMKRYKHARTLDSIYESASDFDALYATGAKLLQDMGEGTVFCLIGATGENGFIETFVESGGKAEFVTVFDEAAHAVMLAGGGESAGEYNVLPARGIENRHTDLSVCNVIAGIDNIYTAADVAIFLQEYYAPGQQVFFYSDGSGRWMALDELNKVTEFGAMALLVIKAVPLNERQSYGFYDLARIMKRLRANDGCPWDKEQTHKTLRQYLIEETYEAVEAIDEDDMHALYDELGDVLLQIVFHAEIAWQSAEFTISDVTTAICQKMINRHPHIFGDVRADTPGEVMKNWEEIKKEEKGNETYTAVLKDIPKAMGAMMRAYKIQKKAANIGFDWENSKDAMQKVEEELSEFKDEIENGTDDLKENEAGDLLFALINVLRHEKINPEVALLRTCEKFIKRFEYMEKNAGKSLSALSLMELDALWEKSKQK